MYSNDPPIISQTAGFICKHCLQTFESAKNVDKNQSTEKLPILHPESESSEIVAPQEANITLENDDRSAVDAQFEPFSLGHLQECIHNDIYNVLLKGGKLDIPTLGKYKPAAWLKDRPKMLVAHIAGLLGHAFEDVFQSERIAVKVAQLVESIYSSRNSRLVLPLSLRENMLIYDLSGRKLLVNYNGSVSAGGSYSSLMNNLKEAGSTPLESLHANTADLQL